MDKIFLVLAEYVEDVCVRDLDIFPYKDRKDAKKKFDELVEKDKEETYLEIQTDEEDLYEAYDEGDYEGNRTSISIVEKEVL